MSKSSSDLQIKSVTHMKAVLEDFCKEALMAESLNITILSRLAKIAKNVEKFGPKYWMLLQPIICCVGNMVSTTKNEESVKPHIEKLCYILKQCLKKVMKLKIDDILPKNRPHLIPNLMMEIELMINKKPTIKFYMLETLFEPLVSLIMSSQLILDDVLETIIVLNELLKGTNRNLREGIRNTNVLLIEGLVTRITMCGDYEIQQGITEILLRLAAPIEKRQDVAAVWFCGNYSLVTKFSKLGTYDFLSECRDFLNALNQILGTDARVVTYSCETAFIGDTKLYKPKSEIYEDLYVDINLISKSLTFCCSDGIHEDIFSRIRAQDLMEASLLSVDSQLLQLTLKLSQPLVEFQETNLKDQTLIRVIFRKELSNLGYYLNSVFKPKFEIDGDLVVMQRLCASDSNPSVISVEKKTSKVSEGIQLKCHQVLQRPVDVMESNLSCDARRKIQKPPLISRNPADIPDNSTPSPIDIVINSEEVPTSPSTPSATTVNFANKLVYRKTPHVKKYETDRIQALKATPVKQTSKIDVAVVETEIQEPKLLHCDQPSDALEVEQTSSKHETINKLLLPKNVPSDKKEAEKVIPLDKIKSNVVIPSQNIADAHILDDIKTKNVPEAKTTKNKAANHKINKYAANNKNQQSHKSFVTTFTEDITCYHPGITRKNSTNKSNQKEKQCISEVDSQESQVLETATQLFQSPAPSKIRLNSTSRSKKNKSRLPHLEFCNAKEKNESTYVTPNNKRRLYNSATRSITAEEQKKHMPTNRSNNCFMQVNKTVQIQLSVMSPKALSNYTNNTSNILTTSVYSDYEEFDKNSLEKWNEKKKALPTKSYNNKTKKVAVSNKRRYTESNTTHQVPAKKICSSTSNENKKAQIYEDTSCDNLKNKTSAKSTKCTRSKQPNPSACNPNGKKNVRGKALQKKKGTDELRKSKNNDSLLKTLGDIWTDDFNDLPELIVESRNPYEFPVKPLTPPFLKFPPTKQMSYSKTADRSVLRESSSNNTHPMNKDTAIQNMPKPLVLPHLVPNLPCDDFIQSPLEPEFPQKQKNAAASEMSSQHTAVSTSRVLPQENNKIDDPNLQKRLDPLPVLQSKKSKSLNSKNQISNQGKSQMNDNHINQQGIEKNKQNQDYILKHVSQKCNPPQNESLGISSNQSSQAKVPKSSFEKSSIKSAKKSEVVKSNAPNFSPPSNKTLSIKTYSKPSTNTPDQKTQQVKSNNIKSITAKSGQAANTNYHKTSLDSHNDNQLITQNSHPQTEQCASNNIQHQDINNLQNNDCEGPVKVAPLGKTSLSKSHSKINKNIESKICKTVHNAKSSKIVAVSNQEPKEIINSKTKEIDDFSTKFQEIATSENKLPHKKSNTQINKTLVKHPSTNNEIAVKYNSPVDQIIDSEVEFMPNSQPDASLGSPKVAENPVMEVATTPVTIVPESSSMESSIISTVDTNPIKNISEPSKPFIKKKIEPKIGKTVNANKEKQNANLHKELKGKNRAKMLGKSDIVKELEKSFESQAISKPSKRNKALLPQSDDDDSVETSDLPSEEELKPKIKRKKVFHMEGDRSRDFSMRRNSLFEPKHHSTDKEDSSPERNPSLKASFMDISISPILKVSTPVDVTISESEDEFEDEQLLNDKVLRQNSTYEPYLMQLQSVAENWTRQTVDEVTTHRCELVRRFMSMLDLEAAHVENKLEQLQELQNKQLKTKNLLENNFANISKLLVDQLAHDKVVQQQGVRMQHRMEKLNEVVETRAPELDDHVSEISKVMRMTTAKNLITSLREKISSLLKPFLESK